MKGGLNPHYVYGVKDDGIALFKVDRYVSTVAVTVAEQEGHSGYCSGRSLLLWLDGQY